MVTRHPKIWKWLLLIAVGTSLLRIFAPLSGPLDAVLTGVFLAIMLAWLCSYWWENRQERQADRPSDAAVSSSDQT